MRHLCYLINVLGEHEALGKDGIGNDSVYVLSQLNDNDLVDQTAERLQGVMIDPTFNVFHRARGLKKKNAGNILEDLSHNRVIICDESHYGTGQTGRIANIMTQIGSPMWYDRATMKKNNTYLLLVSATPFAEVGVNTEGKKIIDMVPGDEYFGVKQMLRGYEIKDKDGTKKKVASKLFDHRQFPF